MKRALVLLVACGYPTPPNVMQVSATVHGLWDGNDGVELELTADGVDSTLTVTQDGTVDFPDLVTGSFQLAVTRQPAQHTCVVTQTDVACTGPATQIALTLPAVWQFDPTRDAQTIPVSVMTQAVSLTVTGALDGVELDGSQLALAVASPRKMLAVGPTSFAVAVRSGVLSNTYTITVDRGARPIEQGAYVKESSTQADDNFGCCNFNYAFDGNHVAIGAPHADGGRGAVYVFRRDGSAWTEEVRLTAPASDPGDLFGFAVAFTGDLLAVGAPNEASAARGVDPPGGESDNSAPRAGAVYTFHRTSQNAWNPDAYIKASDATAGTTFGDSLAILPATAGAAILAVGSSAGANSGSPGDVAGALYLFSFDLDGSSGKWVEETIITSPNAHARGGFGASEAFTNLSFEPGTLLIVGAPGEDEFHNPLTGAITAKGRAYAFAITIAAPNAVHVSLDGELARPIASFGDGFGLSVAASGTTAIVGAYGEASNGHGVDSGADSDHSAPFAGAAYVFERGSSAWAQRHYVKASNTAATFGINVAIAGDLVAIGGSNDASASSGVNNPPGGGSDDSTPGAGAVYMFQRSGDSMTQIAYIKPSNPQPGALFGGTSTGLSLDTLVVGAQGESSGAMGIDPPGGQSDTTAPSAGAVYVFR